MSTRSVASVHRRGAHQSSRRGSIPAKKPPQSDSKPSSPNHAGSGGERSVKKMRLSKALTIPEGTVVSEACRRMAHRRVDAVLLTDANGLLSGIATDKDVAMRVVAEGLRPEQTLMSKIMTRNPIYVSSDSLAIEALQKMVQGKFTHLPVVENGEVVALLDITKCLYDAISKMQKAAEQGSAIAAAVEGIERQCGNEFSAQYTFIETLRERMFKPSLSTIVSENSKVPAVSLTDTVHQATKKMRDFRSNSVVVVTGGKPNGILTSEDVLMRVVAHNLCPELTLVEKVMTANPECATLETTILDALHLMHDGKFLHLPIVDQAGYVVACLDVLQVSHAAIALVGGDHETTDDTASMMMQKFWDTALPGEHPDEEYETRSEVSGVMNSEISEIGKFMYPPLGLGSSFVFKLEDKKGRIHRFSCGSESLAELITAAQERLGPGINWDTTKLLYDDDEGDKVLLVTDSDLVGAVSHAKSVGWKALRLHLDDDSNVTEITRSLSTVLQSTDSLIAPGTTMTTTTQQKGWSSLQATVFAGAVSLTSIGVMSYLKRSQQ